jgi:hypothetical protein
VPSVSHLAPTYLGLDVPKDTISVAILASDRDGLDVERIAHDEASIRSMVPQAADRGVEHADLIEHHAVILKRRIVSGRRTLQPRGSTSWTPSSPPSDPLSLPC